MKYKLYFSIKYSVYFKIREDESVIQISHRKSE